jgi:septal ring factor EnvC (AmiA/AmiB activator)
MADRDPVLPIPALVFRAIVLAVLLAAGPAAGAQDRAATERRLEALRSQIATVERQVRAARTEEAGALAALQGIESEIQLREQLVSTYATSLDSVRTETTALRRSIDRLEDAIESARRSYRRRATHAYMRGRLDDLALILSANTLSEALARARYLRRFTQARRRQVERIAVQTSELRDRQASLEGTMRETQRLLTASRAEQSELTTRRRDRESLVSEVRRRRTTLEGELAQQREDAAALEGLVRELVAAERRRAEEAERRRREAEEAARRAEEEALARRRAEEEAARAQGITERRTRPTPRRPRATPAEAAPTPAAEAGPPENRPVAMSGSFRANRGRLPWPVDGNVSGRFGTRTDPAYGTRIESPGIDITSAPGAGVRAVFAGTVERIGAMSTYGTYVMVSHGGYTTVYGNLSDVMVRQGQTVAAGQALGRAGTSEQRRGAGLFFAVFEDDNPVDPLGWLVGR